MESPKIGGSTGASTVISSAAAVELRGITKRFGAFTANNGIHLKLAPSSLHALVGENGAGKSTLMNVLFGLYEPDEGEILINGKAVRFRSPSEAIAAGIGMVHQHFMLAEQMTALDNVIVGAEPTKWGCVVVSRSAARARLNSLAEEFEIPFHDWDRLVCELTVGERQRLEILKLLFREANVFILDEPSAVLTPQETERLFVNLKKLKERGKSILLISHKLKEVLEHSDEITVIRRGELIRSLPTLESDEEKLAELMVGRKVELKDLGHRAMFANSDRAPAIRVKGISGTSQGEVYQDVSFTVMPGEVLGLAGIQGNGTSAVFRALASPLRSAKTGQGSIEMLGKDTCRADFFELHRLGVGVVPEDRHHEGLMLRQSLVENHFLGQQKDRRYRSGPWIQRFALSRSVDKGITSFDIRPSYSNAVLGRMSGGNQQKAMLARAMDHKPKILLIAQPTRGVDIGAIERIRKAILAARNEGAAIVLLSTELDELITLSDRMVVFFRGQVVQEFQRKEFDEWKIGKAMGGSKA